MQHINLETQGESDSRRGRRTQTREVIVVGAGPYGLSVAAHLQNAGSDPYVIGQPMAFWKHHMPAGMILRSRQEASNISAPDKHLSLRAYQGRIGRKLQDPLPIADFIAYGEWFQRQVAPQLDSRLVQHICRKSETFELTMEDGETLRARSVVLSLGIGLFSQRPQPFATVPPKLAPHSSELNDLSSLRGRRVAVIGKGQSALECAALLHENGALVEIITRAPGLVFRPFAWRKHLFRTLTPGPLRPFSHWVLPPTDLGDIRTARKMADPDKFRRQTPDMQKKLIGDCTRPIGAYWLEPRLAGVPVRTSAVLTGADVAGDRVGLRFQDGGTATFDRVVLATGYRVDITKLHILDPCLRQAILRTADGYPILSAGLETSVGGLFMAGVIGERALGPTLRFVTGTSNAGPRVANAVTATLSKH